MDPLASRHLAQVALSLGRYLRGFEDPLVHVGTTERFAAEIARLFEAPVIRAPGVTALLSYAEAVRHCSAPKVRMEGAEPLDVLIQSLGGPAAPADGARRELPIEMLQADVRALLRLPRLRFDFLAADLAEFERAAEDEARRLNVAWVWSGREAALCCPGCGGAVPRVEPGSARACASCGAPFETFVGLAMVPAVSAVVSFDMLRALTGRPVVVSYQEASEIRPLDPLAAAR